MEGQNQTTGIVLPHVLYKNTYTSNIVFKSKQNITRDIKIKKNVTIARGEWGGDSGERGL